MRFWLLLIILFIIPVSFSTTLEIESTSDKLNEMRYINGSNFSNLSPDSFKYWSCDMDVTPSIIKFDSGKCYCMDTKSGLEKASIGVGNLIECINSNPKGELVSFETRNQRIEYKLKLVYDETVLRDDSSNVSLIYFGDYVNAGSVVECFDDYSGPLRQKYVLYRESPFQILDSSFNGLLTVPLGLHSGDSLKCRTLYYSGASWRDYRDSNNSKTFITENISILNVYMAPAYPDVSDVLNCYGIPFFDYLSDYLNSKGMSVSYNISIFNGSGVLVNSTVVNNKFDATRQKVSYDLSNAVKGDSFSCRFDVSILNERNEINKSVSQFSSNMDVTNFKPIIESISGNIRPFSVGLTILEIYKDENNKIAEFTSGGFLKLKGSVMDYADIGCGELVYKFQNSAGSVIAGVDVDGNYCGHVYFDDSCVSGLVDFKNKANDIKMSFGDLGLCLEGDLYERVEFGDSSVVIPVVPPVVPPVEEPFWLYQENADAVSMINYKIFFNYTKPENATNNSKWLVKHGALSPYNITISDACWDAYPDKVAFALTSNWNDGAGSALSQPSCFDGTNFINVGNLEKGYFGGYGTTVDFVSNVVDGDWDTYVAYSGGFWKSSFNIVVPRLYEEAMWWEIDNGAGD